MKNIKKRDIVFVVVGIAFLIFVGVSMNLSKNMGEKIAQEFYVNAKGQKWQLPTDGKFEFTASSGQYPKFLSGTVDPLKVKVGDTQTFVITIASPTPLKSVKAITETDTKTQELELTLLESKTLSGNYFRTQPYLIDEKGELVINETNASYAEKAIEQIVSKAEAQALVEYTYTGSWVVNDTHTKTYHTQFTAETEKGEKNQMTLAWSDPICEFDEDGKLTNEDEFPEVGIGCLFTAGIEGFDGGDITIPSGKTLAVSGVTSEPVSEGTFIWNGGTEGAKIIVNGTIVLSNGGSIRQGKLYFKDSDNDTFAGDGWQDKYLGSDSLKGWQISYIIFKIYC